jgi:hypothetical protein
MATLRVKINTPLPNAVANRSIQITGTVDIEGSTNQIVQITGVSIKFGENGTPFSATRVGANWKATRTVPSGASGGSQLKIIVTAKGQASPRPPADEDWEDIQGVGSVTVRLENMPPVLTIDPYATEVTPASLPYRLALAGSAQDEGATIKEVKWRVNNSPFNLVDNVNGNWSRWQKVIDLPAGEHLIIIQAIDRLLNTSSKDAPISVRTRFQPSNAELAFAPITYLQELMSFAERWIKIGATGAGPEPQDLADRFFQPFDRITQADLYEQATRRLHQTRIAVEVLRRKLRQMNQPVPPAVEQSYRRVAYESILLQLGTSQEELQAARITDDATRRALAERLGIGVENARPDRLDRITLIPDQVTEAQLEQLFGLETTTNDDPLLAVGVAAEVLNWRLASTRERWALEDSQARDGADGPIPIIDPDVVSEANLVTPTAGNRAYDLWKARKTWLDSKFAEVDGQRSQGFEQLVRAFIGNFDFDALTTQDANGIDISPTLNQLNLDIAAFRFLASCRDLADAGELLETEWRDIIDIIVQVQKKRQYQQWRSEESGLTLAPQYFRLPDGQDSGTAASRWRASWPIYSAWRKTLSVRIKQLQDVKDAYQSALDAAESSALPFLRDSLIGIIGQRQAPPEEIGATAERLTRELGIDLRAHPGQKTTRVNQAIDTLLGAIFSVRAGRVTTEPPAGAWNIVGESDFDLEWQWMSSYRSWRAAMTVFAYPESQLYPYLFINEEPFLNPTQAFLDFIAALRDTPRITPATAREKAKEYLGHLRSELGAALPPPLGGKTFTITEDVDLAQRKALVAELFGHIVQPHQEANYLREIFWLVPMALALQFQRAGHYLIALDWYQTVYAFNLPPSSRKIYRGLELEGRITSEYARVPEWLTEELNPHIFARKRKNAYTRFTVMSIVRCLLDYADAEFSQSSAESVGRARTLYETADDLLNLSDVKPETGASIPFLPNPVWESLRLHAQANLNKIHQGLNIAGVPTVGLTSETAALPSQYRYAALAERAKQLVGIAQQVESAFLTAMERRDAEAYSLMQAGHDLRVAQSTVKLQDLKIVDADLNVQMAQLQQDRAQIQVDYYDQQIRAGLNSWEQAELAAMETAISLQLAASAAYSAASIAGLLSGGLFGSLGDIGHALSALAGVASSTAGIAQTKASFERREQEWRLQKNLSDMDVQIGRRQVLLAQNQRLMAVMERELAGLQLDHATAVVDFLVNKFTNAELYEWMSGVLGRVYNYFLQQATAMARLAQSQLAFERQEPALSVVQADYWQGASSDSSGGTTDGAAPDRRGLTGSARLLQDIFQLDQYAFETRQRKLQLTQTLSLAQIAPLEFQQFRETGQLIFVTPMELFDRDFPGHYLRLIRRVRVSMIALTPPTRGVRATLSASGISRVVIGGDSFETVTARRSGETVAFTSPLNATGLVELEPEGELLLPFEGMGVDTSWDLQLPKAANPFDYRAVADVLLTLEYTALSNPVYRRQVIKQLDRKISGDRIFSFREQFSDSWYELNNADAMEDAGRRMVANFSTRRDDFPPHIEDLHIRHITLRVARKDGFVNEINIAGLNFTPKGETISVGGAARTVEAVVSTRRPNGATWLGMQGKAPVGSWELKFPNNAQVKAWFKEGKIEDIALVVTFGGTTPQWPV